MNQKDYGNFTLDQLRQFAQLTHEMPILRKLWTELLIEKRDELEDKLTPPYYWSNIYTYTLAEQIAHIFKVSGLMPWVTSIQSSDDPRQSVLDSAQHEIDTLDEDIDSDLEPEGSDKEVIGLNIALIRTFEGIWHYGYSLNDLVKMTMQGNDDALFKAVRIDRTIVSCPPIADRITLAEMQNDETFFNNLRNAFTGPSKKTMVAYGPLRYILYQLDEDGHLDRMTRKERCDLFCTELGLYPSTNNDAEKSLDTFIRRWKKERST